MCLAHGAALRRTAEAFNGYAELLAAIANPRHPEHESVVEWAGDRYDPDYFDPKTVKFDDPRKRWKKAFGK